jgi:hypothetical protein
MSKFGDFFIRLKKRVAGGDSSRFDAATQLPPVEDPKVKRGPITLPSHLTTSTPGDSVLTRADRRLATTDLKTFQTGATTRVVMRNLAASAPDLSATVNAYLRAAITDRYVAVAKNLDGTFNREATALLQQLLTRFDVLHDYKDGFSGISSLRSNSESLGREALLYGGMALELVLDKARLPRKLQPVSVTQVEFRSDGENLRPFQNVAGGERDLDIPTFFYVALDQDLLDAYASPQFEASIQPILFGIEFMNDLRRIVKRAIHPRVTVEIDQEKFIKNVPLEAQHDPEKMTSYMNTFISDVESRLNGLEPEDALVFFDTIGVQLMDSGNTSLDAEYKALQGIIDAKVATGARAMPSILGHGSGSQNVASSETLLFMKNAKGAVQQKLNEIYSRSLTLAVRLFGYDVYVDFRYADIDLRPESELEAFRSMHQERVLELLSLGFLSDDEAALDLTGSLTPAGFTPLSGTGFKQAKPADPDGNNYSGTGAGGGQSGGGAQNQTNKPNTPKQAKGPAK